MLDITTGYFEMLLWAWTDVESVASTNPHVVMLVDFEDMYCSASK
jgi:hypothetical protein